MNHTSHPVKCEHELKHCGQCDIAYCSKCKEEWRKQYVTFTATQGTNTFPGSASEAGGFPYHYAGGGGKGHLHA